MTTSVNDFLYVYIHAYSYVYIHCPSHSPTDSPVDSPEDATEDSPVDYPEKSPAEGGVRREYIKFACKCCLSSSFLAWPQAPPSTSRLRRVCLARGLDMRPLCRRMFHYYWALNLRLLYKKNKYKKKTSKRTSSYAHTYARILNDS